MFSYSILSRSIKSGYFLSGVVVALFVWIVDPFINVTFFQGGDIYQQLTHPDALALNTRSVISAVILILSFMGSVLLTRSRRAEDALRDSEDKYRKLFEQSADAILIIEGNKFVDCNPATVKMLGYANKKEFLETHPSELSPQRQPDGRNSLEKADEILSTAFDKGSQRFEWDHKRQNGEIFPVEVLLTPISFGERNILHVVWRDITERKQAEKALIESEKKFRGLLETSPNGMVIVNAKGSIELVNHQLQNMTGYESDELVGQPMEVLIPEKFKNHKRLRDSYLENPSVRLMGEGEVELFVRRKDGSEFPAEISLSPFESADGINISAAIHDITERKQVNEVLTYQANHDALTGLVNRREFERRVERLLSTVGQKEDEHALCYMDLDEFKIVNDTCGHKAGDEMLQQISMLLQQGVRKRDTLARLGGDEFGVLMEHCTLKQAHRVADSLQRAIQDFQFSWEEHVFKVGVSIGLVAITGDTPDLNELMKQADAACYMAKDLGRNRIHVHREGDK